MIIHPGVMGIDISKEALDVFDAAVGRSERVAHTAAGIDLLVERCAGSGAFVLFEATGSYDTMLRRALAAAGIRYARVNPGRARDFARAAGFLAKTDAVDARMLAARSATRFKAVYQALRDAGKPAKLALIAVARKLLVTLNAIVWDHNACQNA